MDITPAPAMNRPHPARMALLGAGLTLLAAAAILGFLLPVKHAGASCGTALVGAGPGDPADAAEAGVDFGVLLAIEQGCSDARQTPRLVALTLLVVGAGLTVTSRTIR